MIPDAILTVEEVEDIEEREAYIIDALYELDLLYVLIDQSKTLSEHAGPLLSGLRAISDSLEKALDGASPT